MPHKCKLKRDSISHLPKLFPDDPWFVHLKRKFKKLLLISPNHPNVNRYLKSSTAIEKESKRHVEKYPGFIIHPLSEFRKYWNILIFILIFIRQTITAFTIAFIAELSEETIDQMIKIDASFSVILLLEVYLSIRTGVIIEETYEILLNYKEIFKKNLIYFILDAFHCMPHILFVAKLFDDRNDGSVNMGPVIYMFTLFIFSFYIYHRITFYASSLPAMMKLSDKNIIIFQIFLRSFYYWHWASCLRQVVIIHLAPDQDDMFEWFEDRFNRRFHVETFEQIVDRYEEVYLESLSSVLNNYTLVESYTRTMLVTLKLTFQSAYGNETSNSVLTMLNTILMLFWGWIYRAYVTIHLSNVIIATVNSEYKYDAFGKELEAYSKAKGLSRDLKIKIKSFYKRIFKKNYFNEDKIKSSTPIHLRKQIMMHSCSHLVEKVHLFKEIPNLILENIISCLKMEIYFPGDVIIKANTIGDAMFFIAFGTTSIYSSSGNLVGTLTDGSYFGEISLLFRKKKRTASVVACELCEIYRLNAKDFHKVIEPHSEILYRLEGISQSRMNATNTRVNI